MDIVNRLKSFMHKGNIAYSVFADNCKIARPTLSQLLTGRNKKVSDEIISKIHKAYPELSIMWLMFGEGPMTVLTGPNENKLPNTKLAENSKNSSLFDNASENLNLEYPKTIDFSDEMPEEVYASPVKEKKASANAMFDVMQTLVGGGRRGAANAEKGVSEDAHIVNIVVCYSDNTFSVFTPSAK